MKRGFYILRQSLYTVIALCYFLWLALNLTLCGFVLVTLTGGSDKGKMFFHRLLKAQSLFVIRRVPGTTFTFSNPHHETFEKPAVIVCNHQSHLDLMGIMSLTPKLVILTKEWVWKNPFYGLVIRYADFFPVSEEDTMNANIEKMLKKGYSVVIFPEGTRSEDSRVRRFHRGAFYMAEKFGLDIIPVYIEGFGKVLPKKAKHLYTGAMTMEVLPRISHEEQMQMGDYMDVTKAIHRMYKDKESLNS